MSFSSFFYTTGGVVTLLLVQIPTIFLVGTILSTTFLQITAMTQPVRIYRKTCVNPGEDLGTYF